MATGPIQTGQGAQPYQPQRPVQKPDGAIQTGQIREGISVQRAPGKEAIETAQAVQQQALLPEFQTIARKMNMRDLVSLLFKHGIEPSEENRNLTVKMLLMGVELSKENFDRLFKILKGTSGDSFMQEAAILALKKGLDDSPAAIKMLANFLRENPQLAQQLKSLLTTMSSLQTAIASGQQLLSSSSLAQLSAIIAQLDGMISQLPAALQKRRKGELFNRDELVSSLRLTRSLLEGITSQVEKENPSEEKSFLLNHLLTASKDTQSLLESLVTHAILSRVPKQADTALPEQYAYWQIPNSLAENPKTIELLIKRDMTRPKNPINPRKTKIIIKTETKELGELGMEMDVEDNNLNIKFSTPEDKVVSFIKAHMEDLQKRMAAHNYKTRSIQVVRKHLEVRQYLIPMLDLDDLRRIQTEA